MVDANKSISVDSNPVSVSGASADEELPQQGRPSPIPNRSEHRPDGRDLPQGSQRPQHEGFVEVIRGGGDSVARELFSGSSVESQGGSEAGSNADELKLKLKAYANMVAAVEEQAIKDELNLRERHFARAFELTEYLVEMQEQNKSASLRKIRERDEHLFILTTLLNKEISAPVRLSILRLIAVPEAVAVEVPEWVRRFQNFVLKRFNFIWVVGNWFRLLNLRIERIYIGVGDALTPGSAAFAVTSQHYLAVFHILSHLGYAIYAFRLAFFTLPTLAHAYDTGGLKGLRKAFIEHSEKLVNDLVWMAVGLITCFGVHSVFISTLIVVALYAFDLGNVIFHSRRKLKRVNKELDSKDARLAWLMSAFVRSYALNQSSNKDEEKKRAYAVQVTSVRKDFLNELFESRSYRLQRLLNSKEEEAKIAVAGEKNREAIRRVFIQRRLEALKTEGVFLFKPEDEVEAIELLAKKSKLRKELSVTQDKVNHAIAEAAVLLGGMVITAMGVAAYALSTSLGVAGITSISSLVTAGIAAATALPPVAIVGLALIATGSAVVIGMCCFRLYRMIKGWVDHGKQQKNTKRVCDNSQVSILVNDQARQFKYDKTIEARQAFGLNPHKPAAFAWA